MNLLNSLLNLLKKKEPQSKNNHPEGVCPNCWGRHEYGGQFFEAVKNNNFDDKYLTNAKKKYINDLEQSKQSNNFWISVILNRFFDGEKFSTIENIDKNINSITKEDISNYFKNSFNDNFVKASFLPKE